ALYVLVCGRCVCRRGCIIRGGVLAVIHRVERCTPCPARRVLITRPLPCDGFPTVGSHTVAMARNGTAADLSQQLHRMDGGRYGSYKSLSGSWDFHNFTLEIGRAQADPFAPPTRMSVRVPPRAAGIPG